MILLTKLENTNRTVAFQHPECEYTRSYCSKIQTCSYVLTYLKTVVKLTKSAELSIVFIMNHRLRRPANPE